MSDLDRSRRFLRPGLATALAALLLTAAALLTVACGEDEPPVGAVAASPETLTLAYPHRGMVELAWTPSAELAEAENPQVFVHLLPAEARDVLRTFDHPLPQAWQPGQEIRYPIPLSQSLLGPPLAAGSYRLTVGLYEGDRRWALESGPEVGEREYEVARVEVPAPQPETVPRLDFEGNWSPLITGQDRQVMGWRFVGEDATLRLSDVPTDGTLDLGLEIGPPPAGVERVAAPAIDEVAAADDGEAEDAGTETAAAETAAAESAAAETEPAETRAAADGVPALRVDITCRGSRRTVSGVGAQDVVVDLAAGEDCALRLRPNYRHRAAPGAEVGDNAAAELARLVRVTWTPRSAG